MTRSSNKANNTQATVAQWVSRGTVCLVFLINCTCALGFILFPGSYAGSFELSGVAGLAALQGLGIAFLMWNATYPLVIFDPTRFSVVYIIVLVQQAIGLAGETWLLSTIEVGHEALSSGILRFIIFDAAGLVLMLGAFIWLSISKNTNRERSTDAL